MSKKPIVTSLRGYWSGALNAPTSFRRVLLITSFVAPKASHETSTTFVTTRCCQVTRQASRPSLETLLKTWPILSTCCPEPIAACSRAKRTRDRRAYFPRPVGPSCGQRVRACPKPTPTQLRLSHWRPCRHQLFLSR